MGPAAVATLQSLAALGALVYIRLQAKGIRGPVRLVKLVPAVCLAVSLADRPLLATGFGLYALGDLLLLDKGRAFLAGLGAFLVGHFCVIPALLADGTPDTGALVAGLVAAAGMVAALWSSLRGPLRLAVPVYAVALAVLWWAATARSGLCAAGAAVFLVSDALLGWNKFRAPIPGGDTPILLTYYAAIGLIAAG